jgi:hypothetical protein
MQILKIHGDDSRNRNTILFVESRQLSYKEISEVFTDEFDSREPSEISVLFLVFKKNVLDNLPSSGSKNSFFY